MKWFCLVALVVIGCRAPCRALSERLCECAVNSVDRDACIRRAATEESKFTVTEEQNQACKALYDQCDCRLIDTPAGKVKCGLARSSPQIPLN